jgi:transcriptional regulator with XRE-family HTH domain
MPAHDNDELAALGRAIRQLREQRRQSVRELASASRTSVRRLEQLERGRLDPGFALLVRLAECLGIRPAVVFERAQQIADGGDRER